MGRLSYAIAGPGGIPSVSYEKYTKQMP